ncbi:MAG: hypothetical protein AAGD00_06560 [Planctomycetota bacterium]
MGFVDDLIEQAEHLAKRDDSKPKQANLRRAVSTAYYALFHELCEQAVTTVASTGSTASLLRARLRRSIDHAQVRQAADWFKDPGKGKLKQHAPALDDVRQQPGSPLQVELSQVAEKFIELREARHHADYDFSKAIPRDEAKRLISDANSAVRALRGLDKSDEDRRLFLLACLLGSRLNKRN